VITVAADRDGGWTVTWLDGDRSFEFTGDRDHVAAWVRGEQAERVVVFDLAGDELTFAEWMEELRQERARNARPVEEDPNAVPVEQW
jgi:hypothetical protein